MAAALAACVLDLADGNVRYVVVARVVPPAPIACTIGAVRITILVDGAKADACEAIVTTFAHDIPGCNLREEIRNFNM